MAKKIFILFMLFFIFIFLSFFGGINKQHFIGQILENMDTLQNYVKVSPVVVISK